MVKKDTIKSIETTFKWEACKGHKPREKVSYTGFFDWCEKQAAKGHKQLQCPICKLWFFKQEWGNVHPNPFKCEKLEKRLKTF